MTVIAAAKNTHTAYIASDSHGVGGGIHSELGSKIIKKNGYFIGFTCSYRVADIIREATTFPVRIKDIKDLRKFRDELKKLLIEDGCEVSAEKSNTVSHPVGLIIISEGNIYSIDSDYQVHEHKSYTATGSGQEVALGALRGIAYCNHYAKDAVMLAVDAAIFHCSGCGGDIHFEESKKIIPKKKVVKRRMLNEN